MSTTGTSKIQMQRVPKHAHLQSRRKTVIKVSHDSFLKPSFYLVVLILTQESPRAMLQIPGPLLQQCWSPWGCRPPWQPGQHLCPLAQNIKKRLSVCSATATTLLPLPVSQCGWAWRQHQARHFPGSWAVPAARLLGIRAGTGSLWSRPWHPSTDATFNMLIEDITG